MTPTLASITLQLLLSHNYSMCGMDIVATYHRDLAMDAIYWLECPTATPILEN